MALRKLNIFEMLVPVIHFVERRNLEYLHQKSQPAKVPRTPYFSALMALATSLAVTRPHVLFVY